MTERTSPLDPNASDALSATGFDAWIGRSEVVQDDAALEPAVRLAAILDAPSHPAGTDPTPLFPLGHWLQFTPSAAMRDLGADGHPKLGAFMPPLDLPRRMWAGSAIEFHTPILTGQHLSRTTTITAITPKEGASGRLCFVKLTHEVRAENALALVEHQTIVYREAATLKPNAVPLPPRQSDAAPVDWEWVDTVSPDEVMLFRYSALTFNSHRIHYDLDYASRVEGYPGLVVHGPLSATLLVDRLLRFHPGASLSHFEFSARAPLFVNETAFLCGRTSEGGTVELAVIAPDGSISVTARATLQ